MTHFNTKRVFVGVGWFYYQSKLQVNRFGSHSLDDSTFGDNDNDKGIDVNYRPALRFLSSGFFFRADRIWGAWQYRFRSTRLVPTWAPIFDAAYGGNIPQIIKLLEDGEATINDNDRRGWNILHVSFHH